MITNQQATIDQQLKTIQIKESELKELEVQITSFEQDILRMELSQDINSALVRSITSSKTAIVKNKTFGDEKMELEIEYADVISDQNNQYVGLNRSNESAIITINKDVPVFLADWSHSVGGAPVQMNWQNLQDTNINGLFLELFERNGEVVFILEQYIP